MITKFRAYSKEENEMYYPHNDKNVDWTIDDETGFIAPLVNLGGGMWGMIDKYELMQSTGLKDKNGVEIFEGDLVEHDDNLNGDWETFEACEVVYDKDYAQFCFKWDAGNFLTDYRNLNVIGNIYENSELLEE
ncbi:YopX family protein [Enterococcus lactis]|uniref:YopX family protein n=1 Tax=Enterococcus lactis TaxID=357441 RepID=UPI0022E6B466|nr:YopX family protein [Enterococcus lactis]